MPPRAGLRWTASLLTSLSLLTASRPAPAQDRAPPPNPEPVGTAPDIGAWSPSGTPEVVPAPQDPPGAGPGPANGTNGGVGFAGGPGVGPAGGLAAMFTPAVGRIPVAGSYGVLWFPEEHIRFQNTELGYVRQDLSLSGPLWQDARNEWGASVNVREEQFHTGGTILPDTRQPFPDELWDVRFGTNYRHQFDNGWIAGASLSFGSASNQPFHGIDELTAGANGFLRIPSGERNAWLFSINYSTNSQINVPIPGVAYLYNPSDHFQAVLGFPFAGVTYRPTDDVTLQLNYALLTNVHARAGYRVVRGVNVYAALDVENENYFLVPREDSRDRFFYYEDRLSTGVQFVLGPKASLDLSGGYVFHRHYFEGRSLSDRDHNRIDLESGPYLGARFQVRY